MNIKIQQVSLCIITPNIITLKNFPSPAAACIHVKLFTYIMAQFGNKIYYAAMQTVRRLCT